VIGVDVGGTFTDVVSFKDGHIRVAKVPTAAIETFRSVLDGAAQLGVGDCAVFNHASTHGINAIITRRIPKIGFVTTHGHRDMLDMARIVRPREANTDPSWRRQFSDVKHPLVPRYLRRGIEQRMAADGRGWRGRPGRRIVPRRR